MHGLWANFAVPEFGEAALLRFGGGSGALISSRRNADVTLDIVTHWGAEAHA